MIVTSALYDLVPIPLRDRTYIAGGAAVPNRLDQPRDIDLWVLSTNRDLAATMITQHLDTAGISYTEFQTFPYKIDGLHKLLQAYHDGRTVQIMIHQAPNVQELLKEFDLTVHAYALDSDSTLYKSEGATLPGEQIRVQRWTTPHSTLRRLFTLSDRYKSRPNWQDVSQLARLLLRVEEEKTLRRISEITGEDH